MHIEPNILQDHNAKVRVQHLSSQVVRITHAHPSKEAFPTDRPWLKDVFLQPFGDSPDPGEDGHCKRLSVKLEDGRVQVIFQDACVFQESAAPVFDREGGFAMRLRTHPEESFYGWGEWFNAFQRQRGKVVLRARESISITQGRQTYSTIPFFLSIRGFGFFLLNSHKSHWKLQPEEGCMIIQSAGPPADYLLIYGPSFKRILAAYTSLTGRPPLLPKWAFGLWVTSYPQGNQDTVLAHVTEHRRREIPLDAVILDYHWEERFHNFRWRASLFPGPDKFISKLQEEGIRLGLIFTPFLNRKNQPLKKIGLQLLVQDIPKGMLFADERSLSEYQTALEKGYLAHPDAAWWFGKGGMFDFSNPEAAAWWQEMMRTLYEQGVDFFKNDDGEYLPDDATSALGMDGREYHNLYGFYYGKAIYEGMAAMDLRRGLIYARSVWAGSQRYPGVFMGDQKPTFKCIQRTMRAGLNLGLTGFAYWTADVFGLDGKTTEEMHMRYAQWALLNPLARYFWRPSKIDDTRFPWSHSQRAEDNFRRYTALRYQLLPYFYALAWQAWQEGLPMVRPMLLEFQEDACFADIYDQYMLGENLLVAPVVEKGAKCRCIVLPEGIWHDFWSNQVYEGPGQITYPAPLERLPVLVKGGSILPMGPVLQHIPDEYKFDEIILHCYPPFPAEGLLYEDDGLTTAYQHGVCWCTKIQLSEQEDTLVVKVIPDVSGPGRSSFTRTFRVILHGAHPPVGIMVEVGRLLQWEYSNAFSTLTIEISGKMDEVIKILIHQRAA